MKLSFSFSGAGAVALEATVLLVVPAQEREGMIATAAIAQICATDLFVIVMFGCVTGSRGAVFVPCKTLYCLEVSRLCKKICDISMSIRKQIHLKTHFQRPATRRNPGALRPSAA